MTMDSNKSKSAIVRFYADPQGNKSSSRDAQGRSLEDIWRFSDKELEWSHDYIQVLFPLPEFSAFNFSAPHIDRSTRDDFLAEGTLREHLFRSFQRMAAFYGFDASEDHGEIRVEAKPDFTSLARRNWLKRFDHNHLRISRIIRSLRVLGLEPVATAFHQALVQNAAGVSDRSLMYWDRAARRPLHLAPDDDDETAEGIDFLRD